ncbi:MAG: ACT domain-containing protein, partial [Sphingobacteriales bacterium]
MVIVIQCSDKVGLVAVISNVLAKNTINIISMREHVDTVSKRFFLRIETEGEKKTDTLEEQFKEVLPSDVIIHINPIPEKKIIVLVTKDYHCLSDILIRNHFKTLGATVQCVIGNHDILEDICKRFDIPFHSVSHENSSKEDFELNLSKLISEYNTDYL